MGSFRPRRLLILFFCFNLLLFSSPLAQHFLIMTDEQWVELAVDMIRKGVQQQDITKILRALAPEISAKGQVSRSKADEAKPARSGDLAGTICSDSSDGLAESTNLEADQERDRECAGN